MNHTLNIGFVNAHTEGDRAAQHTNFVADELFLRERTLFVTFTGVVASCLNALVAKIASDLVSCPPGCGEE